MKNKTVFRVRQLVYVSDPRMPQYGRRVTISSFLDGRSLGMFLICKDDMGNELLLRPEEISASKPHSTRA